MRPDKSSSAPAKLVSASASSTMARPAAPSGGGASKAPTIVRAASPTPNPGPTSPAFLRRSARMPASSAAPSQGASMIAVRLRGIDRERCRAATAASPAPPRRAARRARQAAPRPYARHRRREPKHGRANICGSSRRGSGKAGAPEIRRIDESLRRNRREHAGADADVGAFGAAAMQPPRQQQMAGL